MKKKNKDYKDLAWMISLFIISFVIEEIVFYVWYGAGFILK